MKNTSVDEKHQYREKLLWLRQHKGNNRKTQALPYTHILPYKHIPGDIQTHSVVRGRVAPPHPVSPQTSQTKLPGKVPGAESSSCGIHCSHISLGGGGYERWYVQGRWCVWEMVCMREMVCMYRGDGVYEGDGIVEKHSIRMGVCVIQLHPCDKKKHPPTLPHLPVFSGRSGAVHITLSTCTAAHPAMASGGGSRKQVHATSAKYTCRGV